MSSVEGNRFLHMLIFEFALLIYWEFLRDCLSCEGVVNVEIERSKFIADVSKTGALCACGALL